MAYLHERNILHLDLKPLNLMVDGDLHIKVGDFGISKLLTSTVTTDVKVSELWCSGSARWGWFFRQVLLFEICALTRNTTCLARIYFCIFLETGDGICLTVLIINMCDLHTYGLLTVRVFVCVFWCYKRLSARIAKMLCFPPSAPAVSLREYPQTRLKPNYVVQ